MAIILSADSLCDMTPEMKQTFDVHTISYHIIADGKDFRDGEDIFPDQLFELYRTRHELPRTAAVNVGEYIAYFRPWVEAGHEIIHFCLGNSLTSSYQNCLLAAEELGHIAVINSGSLSAGIALQLMDCRTLIDEGKSLSEMAQYFEQNRKTYHVRFILDTLEFLRAGGRCSAMAALSAGLLSIKPVIAVNGIDGGMTVVSKFRGSFQKSVSKFIQKALEQYPDMETDNLILGYAGPDTDIIQAVYKQVKATGKFKNIYIIRASCTICSHCGPGTIGIYLKTSHNCD